MTSQKAKKSDERNAIGNLVDFSKANKNEKQQHVKEILTISIFIRNAYICFTAKKINDNEPSETKHKNV